MVNRILVVEDDEALREGVALNLQYVGYEYSTFENGLDAAEHLVSDHAFDLALLDIMLPGMDGFALFDQIQQYGIPVIFMTAKTDSASEVRGLREGAEDYLVKPFDMVTLLVRIEKVLDRAGKLNRILQVADCEIDTDNRTVTRAGREIPLKPLEFDVLVMLVRSRNRTVPRERLLNEIWGPDYFGGPRTVDVHIANIRRKLGFGEIIRTVPKTGYRLEDSHT